MARNVLIINGHPDPRPERMCAALANAYCAGASRAGHRVRRIDVGSLDFPLITSFEDFANGDIPPVIRETQASVTWAQHIVIVHPLWLGGAPAQLKGFLEQVFRYGFALGMPGEKTGGLLKGRSARVIVTMGMPAPVFRWVFGAHGLKALEQGILWLSGMKPIRHLILGGVETGPRARWLKDVEALGAQAA